MNNGAERGNATKVGWVDKGFLYLVPEVAYAAVQRQCSAMGDGSSVSPRTLWGRFVKEGAAIPDKNQSTRNVKVGPEQKQTRVLCLKLAAYEWLASATVATVVTAENSTRVNGGEESPPPTSLQIKSLTPFSTRNNSSNSSSGRASEIGSETAPRVEAQNDLPW